MTTTDNRTLPYNRAGLAMAAAALIAMLPASASATGTDAAKPRYELRQTGSDEFVRLDTVTGNLSSCSRSTGKWVCKSAADDRKAYRDEIARLEQKNRQLELKIKTIEKKLDSKEEGLVLRFPDEAAIDRMMSYLRTMIEKLIDMARDLETSPPDRV